VLTGYIVIFFSKKSYFITLRTGKQMMHGMAFMEWSSCRHNLKETVHILKRI